MNSGTSRAPTAMGLMHCLFFIAAKYNLLLSAQHLPGPSNDIADALSRNRLHHFYSCHPQACPHPTPIPQQLIALISHKKLDWTSQQWTKMFNSIFSQPRITNQALLYMLKHTIPRLLQQIRIQPSLSHNRTLPQLISSIPSLPKPQTPNHKMLFVRD